jgi:phosphatidate cytidylyltransferase
MSRRPKRQGRWGDLPKRLISAVIMLAVGAFEIWFGGPFFALLVVVLTGLMIWELARMTDAKRPAVWVGLGVFSAAVLFGVLAVPVPFGPLPLLLPPLVGFALMDQNRRVFLFYALAIMAAGHTLVGLREQGGSPVILWLIAVVVASDVMGYFVGRRFGGPKFWPRISPNKTWSGTVAGWFGAAFAGALFVLDGRAGWGLVALSPLIALAGQMGDIAESWVKRRAGVKDASTLIPGHGGVLDRFDALIGAALAVLVLSLLLPLPLPLPRPGG